MKVRKSDLYKKILEQNPELAHKLHSLQEIEVVLDGKKLLVKGEILPRPQERL